MFLTNFLRQGYSQNLDLMLLKGIHHRASMMVLITKVHFILKLFLSPTTQVNLDVEIKSMEAVIMSILVFWMS